MNIFFIVYDIYTYINASKEAPYFDHQQGMWCNISTNIGELQIKNPVQNHSQNMYDLYKLKI